MNRKTMTSTAPDTNALIERLFEMELYEFDVPATKNIGSEGYYRTEVGELAAEALRTLTAERDSLTEHQINQPQLDSMAELLRTLTAQAHADSESIRIIKAENKSLRIEVAFIKSEDAKGTLIDRLTAENAVTDEANSVLSEVNQALANEKHALTEQLESRITQWKQASDYSIELQRLIESFCKGRELPSPNLHHSQMLNKYRETTESDTNKPAS